MLTEKDYAVEIEKIFDTYGFGAQSDVAVEEMAELTKAIMKFRRAIYNENEMEYQRLIDDVAEEIADVQIMLWQLVYFLSTIGFDGGGAAVNELIHKKIDRQLERIKNENKQGDTKNE